MNHPQKISDLRDNPAGYFVLMPSQSAGDEIDLARIGRSLWSGKYLILIGAILGALLAGFHAFYLAVPIYRSQATTIIQVEDPNANAGISGAVSGLAALGGISLGSQNASRVEFLTMLRSRQLAAKLITEKDLIPILFSEGYDATAKHWREGVNAPTLEAAIERFQSICQITDDRLTSLVTIQVDWKDRFLAAQWITDLIELANRELRSAAIKDARANLSYLERQLDEVRVDSLRQSIVRLMETSLNRAMLANAHEDYAIKTIDPPRVSEPDHRVSPRRGVEVVGGFLAGTLLMALVVLWWTKGKVSFAKA